MAKKPFVNKVAVVTGSSRGIGQAIAIALGKAGAKVVLNGRDEDRLREVQSQLQAQQIETTYFKGDVSNAQEAKDLIAFALHHYGQLDLLINNVGVSSRGDLSDLDPSVIEQVFKSNVFGTIFPTQAALPSLRQTKGSIVFISSLAAIHGLPGLSPYSASKMALTSFVESLRIEENAHQVHIGQLQVAMTEIVHNKEVLAADGSKQVLAPRHKGKVLSMEEVAQDCLALIAKRRHKKTQTFIGQLNSLFNRISPVLVEKILLKNLHRFKENSK